jgi:SAM-dependent methyltransferase
VHEEARMSANEGHRRLWNDPEWVKRWLEVEASAAPVTGPLLEAAGIQAGERVLDIGCGGGLTTIAAARAAGAGGSATGVDLSQPLLELARARAAEEGLPNVSFVAADGQSEPFPGGPFEVAISRFGVMFFNDPVAAFGNILAHLEPGGRLAFACWQGAVQNPWFAQPILERYRPAAPAAGGGPPPGPLAFGNRAYVEAILGEAGFDATAWHEHAYTWRDRPGSIADPRAIAGMGLEDEQAAKAIAELRELEARFTVGGEVVTDRRYVIVTARR